MTSHVGPHGIGGFGLAGSSASSWRRTRARTRLALRQLRTEELGAYDFTQRALLLGFLFVVVLVVVVFALGSRIVDMYTDIGERIESPTTTTTPP
jgi:Flp pilus assembly pilin Flp